jgi:hypothetical protein
VQAVVCVLAAQDDGLTCASGALPVASGEFARHIDGVRTARVEDDFRLDDGRQPGQAGGQRQGLVVQEAGEDVISLQFEHLGMGRIGEFRVCVADVGVEQAGGAVEQALSIGGVDEGTFAALDNQLTAED